MTLSSSFVAMALLSKYSAQEHCSYLTALLVFPDHFSELLLLCHHYQLLKTVP